LDPGKKDKKVGRPERKQKKQKQFQFHMRKLEAAWLEAKYI
jgi:hypothetical protein